jgi:hypothetical protein
VDTIRGENLLLLINWVAVTEYALASSSTINNILDFKIRVEIISTHRTLLLLQNVTN